ncbi:hypothetical protein [Demequina soli]|uniref:hypothetical protein n=1 Tax=Demequina soli TaxID=1638987 RepID=UPI000785BF0A|nr:hypothetical protein [Demequina soli]
MNMVREDWLLIAAFGAPLTSAIIFGVSIWLNMRATRRAEAARLAAAVRASALAALKAGTVSHTLGLFSGWPYEFVLRTSELASWIDIKGENPVSKWLVEGVPHVVQEYDAEARGRRVGEYVAMLILLEDRKGRPMRRARRVAAAKPWPDELPDLPRWRKLVQSMRATSD